MTKAAAQAALASGQVPTRRYRMAMGDVMIRDVRALHRGTPNTTDEPRTMVVLGYSRRWLHRPEVHIRVPRSVWNTLSAKGARLLRYNPVVPDEQALAAGESYRAFAY